MVAVLHTLDGQKYVNIIINMPPYLEKDLKLVCASGPWKVTACVLVWSSGRKVPWNQQKVDVHECDSLTQQ
jgi:hypothetical protein